MMKRIGFIDTNYKKKKIQKRKNKNIKIKFMSFLFKTYFDNFQEF